MHPYCGRRCANLAASSGSTLASPTSTIKSGGASSTISRTASPGNPRRRISIMVMIDREFYFLKARLARLLVVNHPYSSIQTAFRANTAGGYTKGKYSPRPIVFIHNVTSARVGGENAVASLVVLLRGMVQPSCVSLVILRPYLWHQSSSRCLKTTRTTRVVCLSQPVIWT